MFSLEADTAGLKRQILGLPRRSIDYTDSPRQRQATQPHKSPLVIIRTTQHNDLRHIAKLKLPMLSIRKKRTGSVLLCTALLMVFSLALPLRAQENNVPEISAAELVRLTIAHEMKAAQDDSHKHLFRSRKQIPRGSQTRLYIETNDSMAGMTIAYNDQPLNPQQQKAEQDHLAWLANNPQQLRKKRAQEKADEQRTLRILRALPDAFLYEYAGTETGDADLGKPGDPLTKLNFTPNPSYSPPTRVEQVLQGLKGHLLIDASAHRLARIEGTLFRDVTFGWGIIGHLDKGGYFRVQQADVGDGSWEITSMKLKVTGKILLLRGLSITTDEVFSHFHPVPAHLTFAEAAELLKSEQEKLAHEGESQAQR